MTNTPQFDVGSAALQHLELLNHSDQNPLEIAAQFRTLLRSKKANKNTNSSNSDYTYADYIAAGATIRRRGRSQSLGHHRSKSLSKIQYDSPIDQPLLQSNYSSGLIKNENIDNSTDEPYPDSAVGSDSSDLTNHKVDLTTLCYTNDTPNEINYTKPSRESNNSNRFQYPTINWKQLRERQYENKLDKVKKFLSTKFKTIRLSKSEAKDLTLSSLTNISNKTDSFTCSNLSGLERNYPDIISNENISSTSSRSRSSSNSIRTPSISPRHSPRANYTISRLNSTVPNHSHDAIFFPIADCNLIIRHEPIQPPKRISHVKNICNQNKVFLC